MDPKLIKKQYQIMYQNLGNQKFVPEIYDIRKTCKTNPQGYGWQVILISREESHQQSLTIFLNGSLLIFPLFFLFK